MNVRIVNQSIVLVRVVMMPAGYEHGSDGPNSADFTVSVVYGTRPPGSHEPGHHYMEEEGYIPSLQLVRTPTDRYKTPANAS